MEENKKILNKVLFVGPAKDGPGGMSSVLHSYCKYFPVFNYISVNSRFGKLIGRTNFLLAMLRIPFARLKGRKLMHLHYACGRSWAREQIVFKWAKLLGYKVVMHCHGAEFKQFCNDYGPERIGKVLRKADANIFLTKSLVDYFSKELKLNNVFAVNNIVAQANTNDILDKSQNTTTPKLFTFIFLGYIIERKGILDLLKAFADATKINPNIRLKIGGAGSQEDEMKAFIKEHNLKNYVEVLGWVTGNEKDTHLQQSEALVLPSYNEGLPICILEAMSNKVAVIATPVGGIPDLITDGKNGLLVNPGDINALTNAICRISQDAELRENMTKSALTDVTQFYPHQVEQSLCSIFEKVLNNDI